LVGGGSGCLTLSSSHFRPPLRPAPGPAPTIPAPPNPLPADTSPEDAESQALLDEAMEMATGTPAPIRAPVRQVRSCSSLQKLAAVFACWGRVCGVASVEGIRKRAWKRGHWQQAVQLTGEVLPSCLPAGARRHLRPSPPRRAGARRCRYRAHDCGRDASPGAHPFPCLRAPHRHRSGQPHQGHS
jgi:hypothetical protein